MKPVPNLADETAMLKRGRMSALGSARNDASETLRDAVTRVQSSDWDTLHTAADDAASAAERLKVLAAMWNEL